MSDERPVETEGGFGTGLRAQLAKRTDQDESAAEQQEGAPSAQIRAVEVEVRALVVEGVGRAVEDPHHERPRAEVVGPIAQ